LSKTTIPRLRFIAWLFGRSSDSASNFGNDRPIFPKVFDLPPVPQRHREQEFKELLWLGVLMKVRVLEAFKDSNRRGLANVFVTIDVQSFDRFKRCVKLLSVSSFEQ
jgi:hypothetical protein